MLLMIRILPPQPEQWSTGICRPDKLHVTPGAPGDSRNLSEKLTAMMKGHRPAHVSVDRDHLSYLLYSWPARILDCLSCDARTWPARGSQHPQVSTGRRVIPSDTHPSSISDLIQFWKNIDVFNIQLFSLGGQRPHTDAIKNAMIFMALSQTISR